MKLHLCVKVEDMVLNYAVRIESWYSDLLVFLIWPCG
eukprot:XP_001706104.1 Hypothetical protein GL50803_36041 [Giardia lamblia ATCC 50803]